MNPLQSRKLASLVLDLLFLSRLLEDFFLLVPFRFTKVEKSSALNGY